MREHSPGRRRPSLVTAAIVPAFLMAVATASPVLAGAARLAPTDDMQLAPLSADALAQIQAVVIDKKARTTVQEKLDSQFLYAIARTAGGPAVAAAPSMEPDVRIDAEGRVLVDMTADVGEGLLQDIRNAGGTVVSSVPQYRAIRAILPLSALEGLAGRPDVQFIERAAEYDLHTGSVTGEGDVTHRAARARQVFGVNGAGRNIGALSDSSDFLATSQGLGDLGTVTVLAGQSGVNTCGTTGTGPCTGEGTAMLEILADVAPGAGLFFATGNGGPAQMAANIQALQAAGCNIIVDDLTYLNESPFQDGPVAQAVNAVSAAGALYFSSARNSGNLNDGTSSTWEGDFVDGGATAIGRGGRIHDFGGGTTFNTVAAGGSRRRVDLFWADPLGASSNDYDVYVLDSTGTNVLRSSTNTQNGSQNPYEFLGTLNAGERIVIVRNSGAGRFLHLDIGRGQLTLATAGCVRGHNASGAANAFSVAATDVANSNPNPFAGGATNPVETFSSDGPRRMFFDPSGNALTPGNFSSTGGVVLQKPDITAADGAAGSTAVPGFSPFFGTSAAAPHAAAIAALVWSSNTGFTPAQIRGFLTSTALDIEAAGSDRDSGVGIVMAFGALKAANPCTVTCPANITLNNDPGVCGATVAYAAPTLAGGCGGVTCVKASGSFFDVGTSTVTCTTDSEDSCGFTVRVNDAENPSITCPANVTQGNDPGLCSAVVSYASPTVSDNCPGVGAPACVPPSGSTFPKGATPVACSVADGAGNSAGCGFSVTVNDIEPPVVECSVGVPLLWPPAHDMFNVGLTGSATDNCPGPIPIALAVFADEDDETPTGDGIFSPDAADVGLGTLRLRAERIGGLDGRVYLDLLDATDTSGNVGHTCCRTVVPTNRSGQGLLSIDIQAANAVAACMATGAPPSGFVAVGDGPVIGSKP